MGGTKMSKSKLADLEIYSEAVNIANEVWDVVISWNDFEKKTIGSQLCRSIDSVGANIAEGFGRGSKLDNARFSKIARASLFESKHWLMQANRRRLLSNSLSDKIRERIDHLIPRISAYINYLQES
jgi:four helix bundle protein